MKNWNSKCMVGALIINIPLGVYNNNIIGRINNTPLIFDDKANMCAS